MNESIEIQTVEPDHIPEAKRVIAAVARGVFGWPQPVEEVLQRFTEHGDLRDLDEVQAHYFDRGGILLIALDDGQVIGTGAILRRSPTVAELKRLALLEPYQGRGIGYQLLRRLVGFARETGYRSMLSVTDPRQTRAIDFLRQAGFRRTDCPEADAAEVCMEMAL